MPAAVSSKAYLVTAPPSENPTRISVVRGRPPIVKFRLFIAGPLAGLVRVAQCRR